MIDTVDNLVILETRIASGIPKNLYTAIYYGELENARGFLYDLLLSYSQKELDELMIAIDEILKYELKLDPKKLFSLKAMQAELLKRLEQESVTQKRIDLLHANQWLAAFNNDESRTLHRRMRNYALKLQAVQKKETTPAILGVDAWNMVLVGNFALILAFMSGPWLTPLIATQLACIGFFELSLIYQSVNLCRTDTYHDELQSLDLTEKLFSSESMSKPKEVKARDELMSSLTRFIQKFGSMDTDGGRVSLISEYFGYGGCLHALQELDNEFYTSIYRTVNQFESAYRHRTEKDIHSYNFYCYVGLSIVLTALVALSIGLTHTHSGDQIFGGVFLGIVLGVCALGYAAMMVNTDPRIEAPSLKAEVKETVTDLNNAKTKFENKSKPEPLPLPLPLVASAPYIDDSRLTQSLYFSYGQPVYQPPQVLPPVSGLRAG